MQHHNRHERRRIRAAAPQIAAAVARRCTDYHAGHHLPVTGALAVAALERAFTRLLIDAENVVVMEVSAATAADFPSYAAADAPAPGVQAFLAVGMDVSGRGTYCLRFIGTTASLDPVTLRRAAEAMMHAAIAPHLAVPGLPPGGAR